MPRRSPKSGLEGGSRVKGVGAAGAARRAKPEDTGRPGKRKRPLMRLEPIYA